MHKTPAALALFAAALLAAAACGDPSLSAIASADQESSYAPETRRPALPPAAAPIETAPASLTCVSDASREAHEPYPHVWRVVASLAGDEASLRLSRGPQFFSRGGVWPEPAANVEEERSARVELGARLVLADDDGFTVSLAQEGVFFRGEVVTGPAAAAEALLCWDPLELFGSPWGGPAGALAARFDWATGACADEHGEPALNDLPIEVVRETGFGECADLRGAALNGDDLSYPSLHGWHLAGADLEGAELFFADLRGATLHGADLRGLQFGYAVVEGFIDDATRLPEAGCEALESPWGGASVTCMR